MTSLYTPITINVGYVPPRFILSMLVRRLRRIYSPDTFTLTTSGRTVEIHLFRANYDRQYIAGFTAGWMAAHKPVQRKKGRPDRSGALVQIITLTDTMKPAPLFLAAATLFCIGAVAFIWHRFGLNWAAAVFAWYCIVAMAVFHR